VHPSEPTTQFRDSTDTKSYVWDVDLLSPGHIWCLQKPKNALGPRGIARTGAPGFMPDMIWPDYLEMDLFATTMGYRIGEYGDNGPRSWTDFWKLDKLLGRHALYKKSTDTGCSGRPVSPTVQHSRRADHAGSLISAESPDKPLNADSDRRIRPGSRPSTMNTTRERRSVSGQAAKWTGLWTRYCTP